MFVNVSQITIHEALLNVMAVAAQDFPLQDNPFQPGFIREVILANALGHEVNCDKKGVDATESNGDKTEYKTWKTGSWAKLNAQAEQGYKHLIHGEKFQYFAEFSSPFVIDKVWRVAIDKVKEFCKDFMARTKKKKGHITFNFSNKWVKDNGELVELGEPVRSRFVDALSIVQSIAIEQFGVNDITLKGRIREILIAEILNHQIIEDSMLSDARDSEGDYEYLTSLEGNFQMTHMTEENSRNKVFRNKAIYCAQFEDAITISEIWKIDPKVYMKKMKKRRPWPENKQNNFTVTLKWVRSVGELIPLSTTITRGSQ